MKAYAYQLYCLSHLAASIRLYGMGEAIASQGHFRFLAPVREEVCIHGMQRLAKTLLYGVHMSRGHATFPRAPTIQEREKPPRGF